MKKLFFPIFAVLVLAGIFGFQLYAAWMPPPEAPEREPLSELLPNSIPGWTIKDLDLGPTESVNERSLRLLNLDDYVHRSFSNDGVDFSVYVAYWTPGKMPVRLVNQHTPDRCWAEVGWACTDREWNVKRSAGGIELQPAQWGTYELREYEQKTYFWHLVGGEAFWYGGERLNTRTPVTMFIENFRKLGFNQSREQFFIRIIYSGDREALWENPVFVDIMQRLSTLGLKES